VAMTKVCGIETEYGVQVYTTGASARRPRLRS